MIKKIFGGNNLCCVERNRFNELPTIYKMTSTEQIIKKRDDDVDGEVSCGVERNRFKGLPSINKMTSAEQIMEELDDDVDVTLLYDLFSRSHFMNKR